MITLRGPAGIDMGLKPVLNFKGYMVGNGVTDEEFDGNALVPFAHGMALISNDLFQDVTTACNGIFWHYSGTKECFDLLLKVDNKVKHLNIYNILEPCYRGPVAREIETGNVNLPSSFSKLLGKTDRSLPLRKQKFVRAWPFRAPVRDGIVPTWSQILNSERVPCTDVSIATLWLNNGSVRKALHARQENLTWELCSDMISFLYKHDLGSMIPYHKNLTVRGYRALIYRY
ncbi:Peptidase S10 [Macleaya cordata]|uniref:Peptidase S10 n=1 Tax=Macleaya cordata TaxID=56857 RepID=A0A200Q451_MACCD|nr:Peptidase S10 [Macleaya cordata]